MPTGCEALSVLSCKYEMSFFSLKNKQTPKVSVERLTAVHREAMLNNLRGIEPKPPSSPICIHLLH